MGKGGEVDVALRSLLLLLSLLLVVVVFLVVVAVVSATALGVDVCRPAEPSARACSGNVPDVACVRASSLLEDNLLSGAVPSSLCSAIPPAHCGLAGNLFRCPLPSQCSSALEIYCGVRICEHPGGYHLCKPTRFFCPSTRFAGDHTETSVSFCEQFTLHCCCYYCC